ncbi:hypothetical protein D3C75_619750 [compost metagenome]
MRAVMLNQEFKLFLGFHAFGYQIIPELRGNIDDGLNNCLVNGADADAGDEGAVDFDFVDGKMLQVVQ